MKNDRVKPFRDYLQSFSEEYIWTSIIIALLVSVLIRKFWFSHFKRRGDEKIFLLKPGSITLKFDVEKINVEEVSRDVTRSLPKIAIHDDKGDSKIKSIEVMDTASIGKCSYCLSTGLAVDLVLGLFPKQLPVLNSPSWKVLFRENKSLFVEIEGFVGEPIQLKSDSHAKVGPYLLKCRSNNLLEQDTTKIEFSYSVMKSKHY